MTIAKSFLSFICIFVGLWISTEAYQFYLIHQPTTEAFVPVSADEEEAKEVFDAMMLMANDCHVEIAVYKSFFDGEGKNRTEFYCNDLGRKKLQEKYWIQEGKTKSILFPSSVVKYFTLNQLDYESFVHGDYWIVPIGSDFERSEFLGKWQKETGITIFSPNILRKHIVIFLVVLWGMLGSIICSMMILHRLLLVKEFFVRLSVGNGMEKNIVLRLAFDTMVLSLSLIVDILIIRHSMGIVHFQGIACIAVFFLCAVNWFLFVTLLRKNFRLAFSNAILESDSLWFGYLLVACFTIILCVLCALSNQYRDEVRKLKKQESFYSYLQGYYYVSFAPFASEMGNGFSGDGKMDTGEIAACRFYEEYYDSYGIFVFSEDLVLGKMRFVFVNSNGKELLEKETGISVPNESGVICFYPAGYRLEAIENCHPGKLAYPEHQEETWIPYNNEIHTPVLSRTSFAFIDNPVFVYVPDSTFLNDGWQRREEIPYGMKFCARCEEEDIERFAEENRSRAYYEQVGEKFANALLKASRLYQGLSFLSISLIALILFLHGLIVSMEIRINGMELAIEKTMGVSLYDRFYKFFLLNWGSGAAGIAVTVMIFMRLHIQLSVRIIGLWLLILIGESFGIVVFAIRTDKDPIQRILKNG